VRQDRPDLVNRTTRGNAPSFIEVPVPPEVLAHLMAAGSTRVRHYRAQGLMVFTSIDKGLWHLSISASRRYPTWDEIAEARYQLCPDNITMAMLLPPRGEYVNLHDTTFHLHEILE